MRINERMTNIFFERHYCANIMSAAPYHLPVDRKSGDNWSGSMKKEMLFFIFFVRQPQDIWAIIGSAAEPDTRNSHGYSSF
jgi:hypothetical protein